MTSHIAQIERILKEQPQEELNLKALPPEEARVFLNVLKQFERFLTYFDPSWLNFEKDEIKKWGFIYVTLHDLFHQHTYHPDLNKLEILSTAPVLEEVQNFVSSEDYRKFATAYFILGLGSLKTNKSLIYLVSERLILGEFISFGGVENGLWGLKLKENLLPQIAKNILEKTQKDKLGFLLKKYRNFTFDFIV